MYKGISFSCFFLLQVQVAYQTMLKTLQFLYKYIYLMQYVCSMCGTIFHSQQHSQYLYVHISFQMVFILEKDIYFMIIIFCVFISFFHFITYIQWQRLSIRFDADFFLYYTVFKMHIFMMYEAYLIVESMIL